MHALDSPDTTSPRPPTCKQTSACSPQMRSFTCLTACHSSLRLADVSARAVHTYGHTFVLRGKEKRAWTPSPEIQARGIAWPHACIGRCPYLDHAHPRQQMVVLASQLTSTNLFLTGGIKWVSASATASPLPPHSLAVLSACILCLLHKMQGVPCRGAGAGG